LDINQGDEVEATFAYKGATSQLGRDKAAPSVTTVMSRLGTQATQPTGTPSQSPNDNDILSPTLYVNRPLNNNSGNVNQDDLVPTVVITEGLGVTPWYSDPDLLTGNPRLRMEVQPVSFQVFLNVDNSFILSTKGDAGSPIKVELNASMKSVQLTMKHNYHHQRTRTAHHITLWGMQADMIEGTCTTGVFMNQLGLTDYYSTRTIDDTIKKLVTSGLMFDDWTNNITTSSSFESGGTTDQAYYARMRSQIGNKSTVSDTAVFRVAAQDAFAEFLALFKMNGNVWFWNKTYQDNIGETRDWTQVQAWSPVLGVSASQKNARNNDVISRGGVLMSYRDSVYQGYFKTLQWTMDAKNPYKWDFSFTFQVEKTITMGYYPHNQ
jgi:hypothetical protein